MLTADKNKQLVLLSTMEFIWSCDIFRIGEAESRVNKRVLEVLKSFKKCGSGARSVKETAE